MTPQRTQLLKRAGQQLTPQTLIARVEQHGLEAGSTETTLVPSANPADNNKDTQPQPPQQGVANPSQGKNRIGPYNTSSQNNQQPGQALDQQMRNDAEYNNRLNARFNSQKEVQSKPQMDDLRLAVANTIRNGEQLVLAESFAPGSQPIDSGGPGPDGPPLAAGGRRGRSADRGAGGPHRR